MYGLYSEENRATSSVHELSCALSPRRRLTSARSQSSLSGRIAVYDDIAALLHTIVTYVRHILHVHEKILKELTLKMVHWCVHLHFPLY